MWKFVIFFQLCAQILTFYTNINNFNKLKINKIIIEITIIYHNYIKIVIINDWNEMSNINNIQKQCFLTNANIYITSLKENTIFCPVTTPLMN